MRPSYPTQTRYAEGRDPDLLLTLDTNGDDGGFNLIGAELNSGLPAPWYADAGFGMIAPVTTGPADYSAMVMDARQPKPSAIVAGDSDAGIVRQNANVGSGLTVTAISDTPSHPVAEKAGATVTFTLSLSAAATVVGSPFLTLNDGGTASYRSGSGSSAFVFRYTVASGQNTSDLQVTGLTLNGAAISAGGVGFAPVTSYADNSTPQSVTTADVNGDGKPDLVVADYSGGVSVRLNNGAGGFGAATSYPAGSDPYAVTTGDVNGDGKPDLIVADIGTAGAPGGVSVLLNNGSGGFGTATAYAVAANPFSVTTATINGETDIFAASSNPITGGVTELLNTNDNSGTFVSAGTFAAGPLPVSVTTADLRNDGLTDLIVADENGGVSVLLGLPEGGLGAATSYPAGNLPDSVTTADVNGDGYLDPIVAGANGGVTVLLGNGTGTFAAPISYATSTYPGSVTTADVNGDGKPDIILADSYGSIGVDVLLNTSTPVLQLDTTTVSTSTTGANTGLIVDTIAPAAPVIGGISPDTGASSTDGITNIGTVSVSGSAEANSTVVVSDKGKVVGTVTASSAGAWTESTLILSQGTNTITATAADAAANISSAGTYIAVLDNTSPPAPVISGIAPDTGSSSTDGITNAGTVTVNGSATARTTIVVSDNGTVVGSLVASGTGVWTEPNVVLTQGVNALTATATDVAGNISAPGTFAAVLDTTPPAVTEGLTNDTGVSSTDRITSNDALSGGGDPNAIVTLIIDGGTPVTAVANGVGAWNDTPTGLADGDHTVVASETDLAGNTGTASLSFTLDTATPPAPVITGISPDTGPSNTDGITDTGALTVSGTAVAGDTVALYDGTTLIGTTTAVGGLWSIALATALAEGSHALSATAADVAGNLSAPSATYAVKVQPPPALIQTTLSETVAEGQSLGNLWSLLVANGVDLDPSSLAISAVGTAALEGAVTFNAATQSLVYIARPAMIRRTRSTVSLTR